MLTKTFIFLSLTIFYGIFQKQPCLVSLLIALLYVWFNNVCVILQYISLVLKKIYSFVLESDFTVAYNACVTIKKILSENENKISDERNQFEKFAYDLAIESKRSLTI